MSVTSRMIRDDALRADNSYEAQQYRFANPEPSLSMVELDRLADELHALGLDSRTTFEILTAEHEGTDPNLIAERVAASSISYTSEDTNYYDAELSDTLAEAHEYQHPECHERFRTSAVRTVSPAERLMDEEARADDDHVDDSGPLAGQILPHWSLAELGYGPIHGAHS